MFNSETAVRPSALHCQNAARSPLTRVAMDLAAARWEQHQRELGCVVSQGMRSTQVPALFKAQQH